VEGLLQKLQAGAFSFSLFMKQRQHNFGRCFSCGMLCNAKCVVSEL
jgi:hypothetical protein